MDRIRHYIIFVTLFWASSCLQPESVYLRPPENTGEVFVYLQPMPQAAQKLRFILDEIAARRSDGDEIPLALSFTEVSGSALLNRQKLLASEYLPPGLYSGIAITIKKAFILGEEGESALHVFETPIFAEHPFRVTRKIATALFLSFEASGAITAGVGFTPAFSLAESSRPLINLTGYVSDADADVVRVFNKNTMRIVDVIATGRGPMGMVLDELRRRAYVAVSGENTIAVIDLVAGIVIDRLSLNFGDEPIYLALTLDGRKLVAVNYNSNTVSIIDATSLFEINRIRVGERPTSAAINLSGSRVFITNSLSNTVSVVDLNRFVLMATLQVDQMPLRARFNRSGDELYVISRDSPNLTVIDPQSLLLGRKIFAGMGAISIEIDRHTDLIYVGKRFGGEIAIIEPRSLMFIDTIETRGRPEFLAIDKEANSLLAVLTDRGVLQKINLTSKRTISEIEMGKGAYAVVVMGER